MRAAVALLLVVTLTACASYPGNIARDTLPPQLLAALNDDELGLSWRQHDNPAAVVVLIHGLNLDPTAMRDIQQLLFTADMDVLSVSLTGHANALDSDARLLRFQEATFAEWQVDIRRAVQVAGQRARALERPLYLVGFSLGGLLSADYLVSDPGAGFESALQSDHEPDFNTASIAIDRMVLLSPAISLKWSSYLLYPLQIFPDVFLPSVAPGVYRANNFTPVSAYLALYDGVRRFNELAGHNHNQQALNIPALVFVHPRDELVSVENVREFVVEKQLERWQLVDVSKSGDAGDVLDHLIVGPHSLGSDAWQSMSMQILDFLRED